MFIQGSKAIFFCAALGVACVEAGEDDCLRNAGKRLRAEMATELAKGLVSENLGKITSRNPVERRDAVLFFGDIRAKQIILCSLRSGDWVAKTAALKCLGVFDAGDVVVLYEICSKTCTTRFWAEQELAEKDFVARIAERVSSLLRVDHKDVRDFSEAGLFLWWRGAIERAKAAPRPEIEAATKYFKAKT